MATMKCASAAALLCMFSLISAPSQATAVIGINFEGDTIGQAPATAPASDPMTKPSAIGGFTAANSNTESGDIPPTSASGTVVIGSPSGDSKEAVFTTNSTNAELGALYMDVNGFNLAAQQIQMSFDVNILNAPTSATAQNKLLSTGGHAGIVLGMNTYTTAGWAFRFAAAVTDNGDNVFAFRTEDNSTLVPFFHFVEGTQYHLNIVANYSTGKLDAYIDGTQKLSGYAFWATGHAGVTTDEYFFHLNGEMGNANSVSLDNIASTAVPEAGAFLLGGLACVAAGVGAVSRKYFRKARA